jgi:hypothetical protein
LYIKLEVIVIVVFHHSRFSDLLQLLLVLREILKFLRDLMIEIWVIFVLFHKLEQFPHDIELDLLGISEFAFGPPLAELLLRDAHILGQRLLSCYLKLVALVRVATFWLLEEFDALFL